jgi:hypothetical protein
MTTERTPEEREAERARNQALMPETMAEVAGWRRVFGEGARLTFATEGEQRRGVQSTGWVPVSGSHQASP